MKKLMTMIAAVATAFGLYAADTADIAGINSFEDGNDAGVVGKKFTPANAEGWSFSGTEGTEFDLGEYAEDAYEYSTTTGNKRRTEFVGSVNDQFLTLDTGTDVLSLATKSTSVFADQVVKFTGYEDAPALVDDTKIAVWMEEKVTSADDAEVETTETNLYVSAYNATEGVTNYLIGAANQYKLDKWYRITIKSLGNIINGSYAARLGFVVYVDGEMVASEEAKTAIDVDTLKNDATKALATDGKLFPAITGDTTFASVGYAGVGSVDDVVVDDLGPEFARKIPFTVAGNEMLMASTIKDEEGNDVDPADGVANGTKVIVTWAPNTGYKILGAKTTSELTITEQGQTIAPGDDIDVQMVVATLTVDTVTTDLAESELAAALAALDEGDVIATVKACSVYTDDDEPATIWAFTPNTTITGTETGWTIYVGSYTEEEETVAGSLAFNGAVAASETLAISFDEELEGDLTFGGTVAGALEVANGTMIVAADITLADGASIKAAAFNFDDYATTITLQEGAEVKATDDKIAAIGADDDLELEITGPVDDYYTYTAVEPAPTAFFPTAASVVAYPGVTQDGSAANPWLLTCYDDLVVLQSAVAAGDAQAAMNFKQTDDIDFTDKDPWTGIGAGGKSFTTPFKGTYDGNGKKIESLVLAAGKYMGLFVCMDGGAISNLTVSLSGTGFADGATGEFGGGAFVGAVKGGTIIKNVTVEGTSFVGQHNLGGICAYANAATFENCTNALESMTANNYDPAGTDNQAKLGGILAFKENGETLAVFRGCVNKANLSNNADQGWGTGAILGASRGSDEFYNCRNEGSLTTVNRTVGVLFGVRENNTDQNHTHYVGAGNTTTTLYPACPVYSSDTFTGAHQYAMLLANDDYEYVETSAFEAGKTFATVKESLTPAYQFADAGTIAFNTNLYKATAFDVTAVAGFEVAETAAGGVVTFTATAIPQFDVTFTKDGTEISGSAKKFYRDYVLAAGDIPAIADEGAWDVQPVGAVITSNTNFNFTVKKGGVTPEKEPETPEGKANLKALNDALGAKAAEWQTAVYGGAAVPVAALEASTPELIEAAAAYNLKVMADPVTITPEAVEGGFTFTLKDKLNENPVVAASKVQEMMAYTSDLKVDFARDAAKKAIKAEYAEGAIKVEFTYKDLADEDANAGFMKVDLSVAE